MKGDQKKKRTASDRAAKIRRGPGGARQLYKNQCECAYCGRVWTVHPKGGRSPFGFVLSGANNHAHICQNATPAERRAIARMDEKKWETPSGRPTSADIRNNPSHPGYGRRNFRTEEDQ